MTFTFPKNFFATEKPNMTVFVQTVATKTAPFNLKQNKKLFTEAYKDFMNVCKKLVALSEKYKVAMSVVGYVACGSSAYRPIGLMENYQKFNEDMAENVLKMGAIFKAHHNPTSKALADRQYHALYTIYRYYCDDIDLFKKAVERMTPQKSFADVKEIIEKFNDCLTDVVSEETVAVAAV